MRSGPAQPYSGALCIHTYWRTIWTYCTRIGGSHCLSTGAFLFTVISLPSNITKMGRKYLWPVKRRKVGMRGKWSTDYLQVAWPGGMRGDHLQVITWLKWLVRTWKVGMRGKWSAYYLQIRSWSA